MTELVELSRSIVTRLATAAGALEGQRVTKEGAELQYGSASVLVELYNVEPYLAGIYIVELLRATTDGGRELHLADILWATKFSTYISLPSDFETGLRAAAEQYAGIRL